MRRAPNTWPRAPPPVASPRPIVRAIDAGADLAEALEIGTRRSKELGES